MNKAYVVFIVIIVVLSIALGVSLSRSNLLDQNNLSPSPTELPVVTSSPSSTQTAIPSPLSNLAPSTEQEHLDIFNVQFTPQSVVTVTLANSGTYDVKIDKVFVDHMDPYGVFIYSTGSPVIPANSVATLSFNYNYARGMTYEITVETINGKDITYRATPP
jgi:hypothetical protein